MDFSKYQELARRTSGHQGKHDTPRLLNASLGLAGEAGELANKVKKMVYHQHPNMDVQIREEIGDCAWYLAEIASAFGFDLGEIAQENIAKLEERYPNGFRPEDSINRT